MVAKRRHERAQRREPAVLAAFNETAALRLAIGKALGHSGIVEKAYRGGLRKEVTPDCVVFINSRSLQEGRTLLHEAAVSGARECMLMLLDEYRAKIESKTSMGHDTPLHLAAARGHRQCAFELLTRGANPNPRNSLGRTPLHYSLKTSVTRLLVRCGSLATIEDRGRQTPILRCIEADANDDLVAFLEGITLQQKRDEYHSNIAGGRKKAAALQALRKKELAEEEARSLGGVVARATSDYKAWRQGQNDFRRGADLVVSIDDLVREKEEARQRIRKLLDDEEVDVQHVAVEGATVEAAEGGDGEDEPYYEDYLDDSRAGSRNGSRVGSRVGSRASSRPGSGVRG